MLIVTLFLNVSCYAIVAAQVNAAVSALATLSNAFLPNSPAAPPAYVTAPMTPQGSILGIPQFSATSKPSNFAPSPFPSTNPTVTNSQTSEPMTGNVVNSAAAMPPATLTMADKEWKLGFKDENNNSQVLEFVINNENVNNWTELFTFQKFKVAFPKEILPASLAEKELAELKMKGYQPIFTTIENSQQEILIEFRVNSPIEQDELQRIIRTPADQFIVLQYAVHKSDMGDAERNKWIEALKKIDANLLIN